jgi:hypothetical protein
LLARDEPQMYVGEEAKKKALDDTIRKYLKKFGYDPSPNADNTNSRIEREKNGEELIEPP